MEWIELNSQEQLEKIIEASKEKPQVIFKHSTRCSISSMAKGRLERTKAPEGVPFYYLDLIRHRDISNNIAEKLQVHHESPQILILKNGECVYDESHMGIRMEEIAEQTAAPI